MLKTKVKEVTLERVRQSELGIFINLIHSEIPIEDITSLQELASRITEGFNVDCRASDIERFYALDNYDDNFEVESKKIEYGI